MTGFLFIFASGSQSTEDKTLIYPKIQNSACLTICLHLAFIKSLDTKLSTAFIQSTGMVLFILLVICLSCLILFFLWSHNRAKGKLPPGPTPLPIIGNILQINTNNIGKSLSKVNMITFLPTVCSYSPISKLNMISDTMF